MATLVLYISGNKLVERELPHELIRHARGLIYDHARYCDMGRRHVLIRRDKVVFTKFEPVAALNALSRMREASEGIRTVRPPISVCSIDNGHYQVIDGNATALVAAAAGWPQIPASLVVR